MIPGPLTPPRSPPTRGRLRVVASPARSTTRGSPEKLSPIWRPAMIVPSTSAPAGARVMKSSWPPTPGIADAVTTLAAWPASPARAPDRHRTHRGSARDLAGDIVVHTQGDDPLLITDYRRRGRPLLDDPACAMTTRAPPSSTRQLFNRQSSGAVDARDAFSRAAAIPPPARRKPARHAALRRAHGLYRSGASSARFAALHARRWRISAGSLRALYRLDPDSPDPARDGRRGHPGIWKRARDLCWPDT